MPNNIPVGVAYADPNLTGGAWAVDGTAVTASAAEINYTDVTAAGTAQASKALILDANKRASSLGTLTFAAGEGLGGGGGFTPSPRTIATGGVPAISTTQGGDTSTGATTEVYFAEVPVTANVSSTGVGWLNGSAVAGNVTAYLYDSAGVFVAKTASTAQSGTNAYQQANWAGGAVALKGPAPYYIGWSGDTTGGTQKFRTHTLGNFGQNKVTGQVYGTQPATAAANAPTAFVTALGPIASLF